MSTYNRTATKNDTRQERLQEARAILEQGLDHVTQDPEALAEYLRFRAHFRTYSRQNTMLLLMQRPSARYCMGFRQWQKHGRYVKKGEKGLVIFAPILRRPTEDEIAQQNLDPLADRVLVARRLV